MFFNLIFVMYVYIVFGYLNFSLSLLSFINFFLLFELLALLSLIMINNFLDLELRRSWTVLDFIRSMEEMLDFILVITSFTYLSFIVIRNKVRFFVQTEVAFILSTCFFISILFFSHSLPDDLIFTMSLPIFVMQTRGKKTAIPKFSNSVYDATNTDFLPGRILEGIITSFVDELDPKFKYVIWIKAKVEASKFSSYYSITHYLLAFTIWIIVILPLLVTSSLEGPYYLDFSHPVLTMAMFPFTPNPQKVFKYIKVLLLKYLTKIIKKLEASQTSKLQEGLLENKDSTNPIQLLTIEYNQKGRYLTYTFSNKHLVEHKEFLSHIWSYLQKDDRFIAFGRHKIIILFAKVGEIEYTYHPNVLVKNTTTFEDYYDKIKDNISTNFEHGYIVELIPYFSVKIWNMDLNTNQNIKITKRGSGLLDLTITNNVRSTTNSVKRSFSTGSSIGAKIKEVVPSGHTLDLEEIFTQLIEIKNEQDNPITLPYDLLKDKIKIKELKSKKATDDVIKNWIQILKDSRNLELQLSNFRKLKEEDKLKVLHLILKENYILPNILEENIEERQSLHQQILKQEDGKIKPFAALDIETVARPSNSGSTKWQVPISISLTDHNGKTHFFLINLSNKDLQFDLTDLWSNFFSFLDKLVPDILDSQKSKKFINYTIFVHNLGSFDGLFIFKYLILLRDSSLIDTLLDDKNKFVRITYTSFGEINEMDSQRSENRGYQEEKRVNFNFVDSYRIFPISLDKLCGMFNDGEGKTNSYNPKFNDISFLDDKDLLEEFIEYSKNDSLVLYKSMSNAQTIYYSKYEIDITTVLSTSTLSLKIFKKKFLDVKIPILKDKTDVDIRSSYFGGCTDYYKAYGKNLKYYDINSLYPYAMLNAMPLNLIKEHFSLDENLFSIDSFFGFIYVEVNCEEGKVKRPILPVKYNGETIYPYGMWRGWYFSEELKAVSKYGYHFKYLKGYEFSKEYIFTKYINTFYELKSNAKTPSLRYISKLHLNTLYGIFGRRKDLIKTLIIDNEKLQDYLSFSYIKSIVEVNEEKSVLLVKNNLNLEVVDELNNIIEGGVYPITFNVKSNVAIASATTSYARIHMIPFKIDPKCLYTDTDSVFREGDLDSKFVGKEIGLMKDELTGKTIEEGYFLGIKKYGYWYLDDQKRKVEKSVIAGIKRDSISFDEIIKIFNGETIIKEIPIRFIKNFSSLNINITNTQVSIKFATKKLLVNNIYKPLTINLINDEKGPSTLYKRIIDVMINKITKIRNIIISRM